MEAKDRIKVVHFDDDAHRGIAQGVEVMRKSVGSTYGPGGRNVLIKKKYVAPILTRDGVTVARDIAGHGNRLPNDDANMAAQLVYQASEKTNKTAGDGTTNTVLLLAALYTEGRRRIIAGEDAMVVKRALDRDSRAVVEFIESKSKECTPEMLRQVAEISSGDSELGAMIADLVQEVGLEGAITITYHNAPFVEVEKVTGYLFDQGFRYLSAEVEFEQPTVLVSQKRIAARADIIPILEFMAKNQKQFIIVGDVSGSAMDTFVAAAANQQIDGVVIPPPAYGSDGHDYFEDISIYTGAKVWLEPDNFNDIKIEDLGTLRGARLGRDRAILFGNNSTGDAIAERLSQIKTEQESNELSAGQAEKLEQRYAKLAGKISIIRVGAPTENGRERLFFQVEDAVEACKSALSSGVVAGGATTLLFASELPGIELFVKKALQKPIRLLMANAAEDGGFRLRQILATKYGQGFNLRDISAEPLDLCKAGIIDPTKVITQAVTNAFENAGNLLTVGTTITELVEDEPAH